jgi:hypothetical protein
MNTGQLVELIRKEVRAAIREELSEVIQEAIQIASTPDITVASKPVAPVQQPKPTPGKRATISDLLEETKLNFSSADARSFVAPSQRAVLGDEFQSRPATAIANQLGFTSPEDVPGVDLSQLPFVRKAKQVLDAAIEKDKQKYS